MKRRDWIIGIVIALAVAALLSPFASSAPDGLEWAAERLGFAEHEAAAPVASSPIPDYTMPAIEHEGAATAAAGVAGTLIVAVALFGLGKLIRKPEGSDARTR